MWLYSPFAWRPHGVDSACDLKLVKHGAQSLDENATIIRPGELLVVVLNKYGSPLLDRLLSVGKLEADPFVIF
jgi:hypothetical protein